MMFIENKYYDLYFKIVNNRKKNPVQESYTESHHIIPKSLGGSNDQSNIIDLTAREHFICHYLLTKMTETKTVEWIKMQKAFNIMSSCSHIQKRYFNARLYESQRKKFSEAQSLNQSGENNSQYGTCWIYSVELEKTKRIKKADIQEYLNSGWKIGRILKFSNLYYECKQCNKRFFQGKESKKQFCSEECKLKYKNIYKDADLFLKFYNEYGSINKALKAIGKLGNVGSYSIWARNVINGNYLKI